MQGYDSGLPFKPGQIFPGAEGDGKTADEMEGDIHVGIQAVQVQDVRGNQVHRAYQDWKPHR